MAKKKKTTKKRGPVTVAEIKAKSKAKPSASSAKKTTKAAKPAAKKTGRDAYRFVSEHSKPEKKMTVLDQVQDKLLNLVLEAFEKQESSKSGNQRTFKTMRREWLAKRLSAMVPAEKLDAMKKKIKARRKG